MPYLSAYLDSLGSNFSHGANFATAGSTIRPQNTTMSQSGYSPISLDVQFVQFSDFHRRSQMIHKKGNDSLSELSDQVLNYAIPKIERLLQIFILVIGGLFGTLVPKEEDFSKALYTFDIGQNDLTAGYKLNLSTEQVKAYVPEVLSQLSKVIKVSQAHNLFFF